MSNNRAIVTGRGGVGNVRIAPLKLDVSSHPQTASIIAQHEAANLEYEREVMKRHKETKANTPRVSGRGGIGNITEANPRSRTKPLRRASLFKGGGAGVSLLSPPSDILDMNAFDEEERKRYAQERGNWRHSGRESESVVSLHGPGSGGNSPLSPDSDYSGSDQASASSISLRTQSTGNYFAPEISTFPTTPSKEKFKISKMWKKVSKSDSRKPLRLDIHQDLLLRAEIATTPSTQSFNIQDERNNFPDFAGDPYGNQKSSVSFAN